MFLATPVQADEVNEDLALCLFVSILGPASANGGNHVGLLCRTYGPFSRGARLAQ